MASRVLLHQGLFLTPQNPNQLRFPSLISCTIPLTSNKLSSITFTPLIASQPTKPTFIARADANPESNPEATSEAATNNAEEDAATEEEVLEDSEEEPNPPQRKPRVKLGDVMGILNKRAIEASDKARPIPDIRTGDIVEIKLEVPENKRRLSIYKGIVISKQNAGIHTTIRIRRIIAGVGVDIVFPVYSPNIKEIKVVNHRKVRRARLYYLRDKLPRLSTFK